MKQKSEYLIVYLLFILSFILRICLISKGAYHLDTLNLISKTDEFFSTGVFQSQFGPGYPMMMALCILFAGIGRILGSMDTVFAVNMVSIVTSSLCVPALYVFTRKIYNDQTAIFAALTFSVSPMFLGISVYGKSHAPAVMFLIIGLIYLLNYKSSGRLRDLIVSSCSIGCMGASRVQDMVLMIIPLMVFYFWRDRRCIERSKSIRHFLFAFGIVAGIVFVMHIPYLLNGEKGEYQSNFNNFLISGLTQNFKGLLSASLGRTMQFFQLNMMGVGVLSAMFGFFYMFENSKKLSYNVLILLWIIIPVLFYGNLHTTAPRFFVMILPAVYICLGYFFARFFKISRLFKVMSVSVVLLIFSLTLWKISGVLMVRHNHDFITENARWMASVTEPHARVIMCDERYFVDAYGERVSYSRPLRFDSFTDKQLAAFKTKLDESLGENTPIYITTTGLYFYDPNQQFSDFMKDNYNLEKRGWHLYEDWHRGELFLDVFPNHLYKISLKR